MNNFKHYAQRVKKKEQCLYRYSFNKMEIDLIILMISSILFIIFIQKMFQENFARVAVASHTPEKLLSFNVSPISSASSASSAYSQAPFNYISPNM